ncbi:MAG: LytTR family transcriptional regulator DNA-binding domain-containing protein [Clostridia bacterium]|nr:LytTR family transcriptional regulator DNA-binding domain-containing protein [Clostridia bacterium]
MKCTIVIDPKREEEVIVHAHCHSRFTEAIKALADDEAAELVGYNEREGRRLSPDEIYCFTVENERVYAVCENEKLRMKQRLYQLEETLSHAFVRINQSCMVNLGKISRFDTAISGTLRVTLKNGFTDFVSRRQLKQVKERLGL